MRRRKSSWLEGFQAIAVLIAGVSASLMRGQEKTSGATEPRAYDVNREVTLVGKVVSYSATNATPQLGPRVMLQTSSGMIDIHLEDARLLEANDFVAESGDTLRIIGEEVALGQTKQFVAPIVQKGTRAVTVRTIGGFPLWPAALKDAAKANTPGGAR